MTEPPVNEAFMAGARQEIERHQRKPAKATSTRRFNLVPFDEIKLATDRSYIVKGLIPREGLIVVWGPPKCGKSFWCFDALMHVALAWEYRERRVSPGPVVYVACEGERGLGARAAAFREAKLSEEASLPDFHLVTTRLDLVGDHEELIREIADQIGGTLPVAIAIDTLNRSIRGSESNDKDMAEYIQAADAIREAFKCAVIIVHHCGVEGSRPRGHTSLTGASDAQIAVTKDASGTITCKLEFMKDGPEGDEVYSQLEVVEVGTDQDGDEIASCIITPADAPEQSSASRRLSPKQRRGLEALQECLTDQGRPAPDSNHYPANAIVVHVDQWREICRLRGVLSDDPNTARTQFRRIHDGLSDKRLIAEYDGLVWLVEYPTSALGR